MSDLPPYPRCGPYSTPLLSLPTLSSILSILTYDSKGGRGVIEIKPSVSGRFGTPVGSGEVRGLSGVVALLLAKGHIQAMNEKQRKSMPRSPGRPKGVPNKTTTLLKEAILRAANEAGGGGPDGTIEYLTLQAHQNPAAFMGLLGKVLPMQVSHSGDVPVSTIRIVGPELTDADGDGKVEP